MLTVYSPGICTNYPALSKSPMGFFDFFKPAPPLQDAFFGPLQFFGDSCFEGEGLFAPQNITIVYHIDADPSGPTLAQRVFYQTLQDKFPIYITRIQPLIIEEFRKWRPDFTIQDFASEFTLNYVHIPRPDHPPFLWQLSFKTIHDLNHDIMIDFQDDQPIGILIDG